jgi:hypothetical protein
MLYSIENLIQPNTLLLVVRSLLIVRTKLLVILDLILSPVPLLIHVVPQHLLFHGPLAALFNEHAVSFHLQVRIMV